ncbi:MAG: type II secretion system F family protein [Alphaproteobacteria bacterium]|nr:type II secretion system F family protein [Alphaproteobacteria bacterium]
MDMFFGLDLYETLPLFGVFAAVVLSVLGVGMAFEKTVKPVDRRLASGGDQGERATLRHRGGAWQRLLRPLGARVTPGDEASVTAARQRLVRAGWRSPGAVTVFYTLRVLLAAGLPLLFNLVAPFVLRDLSMSDLIRWSAILALAGLFAPPLVVSHRIAKRQLLCGEGFPDALDLLLVCVQAGLGLDAAIARVGEEIGKAHPLLGDEFHLMSLELRAGKGREDALRNFSNRIGLDEVSALTALLIQSEALGTSIGDALRAHADDMRARRMLRAEEKAQQLAVKLTVPLILFILPALMISIMTPAIINVVRILLPTLNS